MRITLDTKELETACGVLTENGRHLSEFIDVLAGILAECFENEQIVELPDGLRLEHFPSGEYRLICDTKQICITEQRKSLRELLFFKNLLVNHWLDRLTDQISSLANDLSVPSHVADIQESFAD